MWAPTLAFCMILPLRVSIHTQSPFVIPSFLAVSCAHDWQNIQGFWLVFNLFLALGSVFLL
jgi:hypothetical protein